MDINTYLDRIGSGPRQAPTFFALRDLQKNHVMHIPFENLDIHLNRPVALNNFYEKIVLNGRGGFCYELNGLFYDLLKQLGYDARLVSARVHQHNGIFGEEFDHMSIIVVINEKKFLVDVGFGEFSFYPLEIKTDMVQKDPRGNFRITPYDADHFLVSKQNGTGFDPQFIFSEIPRNLREFEPMSDYHQKNPRSAFRKKALCSIPTETGRLTLTYNNLKFTCSEIVLERKLEDSKEFDALLWDLFRIRL